MNPQSKTPPPLNNVNKKYQKQPSNFDLTVNQISSKLGNSKINSNTSKGLMKSKTITKLTMKDENKSKKEFEIISKVKLVSDSGLKSLIRSDSFIQSKDISLSPVKNKAIKEIPKTSPKKKSKYNKNKDKKRVTFNSNFIEFVDVSVHKKSDLSLANINPEKKDCDAKIIDKCKKSNNYRSCACLIF